MSLILSKILFIAKIPSQLNFGLQSGYFAERIRRVLLLSLTLWCFLKNTAQFNFEITVLSKESNLERSALCLALAFVERFER